ncbi:MAG: peptidylprolyl isomerase [Candidatus Magasanikbacteria bacterium]|jgi:cyclophilin family peptidyl-prolyl cis-trans isomerase
MNQSSKIFIIGAIAMFVVIVGALYFKITKNLNITTAVEANKNGAIVPIDRTNNNLFVAATGTPLVSDDVVVGKDVAEFISSTTLTTKKNTMPIAKIKTNLGDITIELFSDEAPNTVQNFVTLAQKGFYNGVIFHRVISGFMIQGGDPTGTGRGGPGYKFDDELNPATQSYKRGYVRGTVAMANSGPNTNGSQFFIMHADYPLPNSYSIFGRVIAGLDTVDAIAGTKTDSSDRPLTDVKMVSVEVEE